MRFAHHFDTFFSNLGPFFFIFSCTGNDPKIEEEKMDFLTKNRNKNRNASKKSKKNRFFFTGNRFLTPKSKKNWFFLAKNRKKSKFSSVGGGGVGCCWLLLSLVVVGCGVVVGGGGWWWWWSDRDNSSRKAQLFSPTWMVQWRFRPFVWNRAWVCPGLKRLKSLGGLMRNLHKNVIAIEALRGGLRG